MKRNEQEHISDEELNAYIDDELDFEERTRIVGQLEQDDELTHEAQELRQLQAMLRHAYRTPPPAPSQSKKRRGSRGGLNALVAGLLLAIGAVSGWYGNQYSHSSSQAILALDNDRHFHTVAAIKENLLLHISSKHPHKMAAALA